MAVRDIVEAHEDAVFDIAVTSGHPTGETPSATTPLSFAADGGRLVTGPLAALQQVLMAFLTVKGSDPVFPGYGTDFVPACRAGYLLTEYDVTTTFSFAVLDMMAFFQEHGIFDDSDDNGKLVDISLARFDLDAYTSRLTLHIELHFASGDTVDVAVPVKVV